MNVLTLKLKNIFYPLILLIITIAVFLVFVFMENTFEVKSNLIYYWVGFVILYFLYFLIIILLETKKINWNVFVLGIIIFIFAIFIAIINYLIALSIYNLKAALPVESGKTSDTVIELLKFSLLQIIYYFILIASFFLFNNFLLSSSYKNDRRTEFINKNILYFLILKRKAYVDENDNFIIETKNILFNIKFLNYKEIEDNKIIFEHKILLKEKEDDEEKIEKNIINDLFNEFEDYEVQKNPDDIKNNNEVKERIIKDSKIVEDFKQKTEKIITDKKIKYSLFVKDKISEIKPSGKKPKYFDIINENELSSFISEVEKDFNWNEKNR